MHKEFKKQNKEKKNNNKQNIQHTQIHKTHNKKIRKHNIEITRSQQYLGRFYLILSNICTHELCLYFIRIFKNG